MQLWIFKRIFLLNQLQNLFRHGLKQHRAFRGKKFNGKKIFGLFSIFNLLGRKWLKTLTSRSFLDFDARVCPGLPAGFLLPMSESKVCRSSFNNEKLGLFSFIGFLIRQRSQEDQMDLDIFLEIETHFSPEVTAGFFW